MSVNKELMKKWIDTLVSRKYKQNSGFLKKTDESGNSTYCCLGVLCDIIDNKLWENNNYKLNNTWNSSFLPKEYREKLGIDYEEENKLATMNDEGKKFYQIARYLRRKYLD